MKQERKYFAILLDEYGGLSGIITLRDIMQLLVGDFYEEDDVADDCELIQTGEREWRIQGGADLEEVSEKLAVQLPRIPIVPVLQQFTENHLSFSSQNQIHRWIVL